MKGEGRKSDQGVMPADTERGDFEKAFADAEVQFDQTYTTPSHHSSAMEPQASVAKWDGDKLTVWSSCQLLESNVKQIADGRRRAGRRMSACSAPISAAASATSSASGRMRCWPRSARARPVGR